MIHLDTNLLIAAIDLAHPGHARARQALARGEPLAAGAVAWTEFLSKPVPTSHRHALMAMLGGRILPFAQAEAEVAAQLFQLPGVKRAQRLDTMIAATAILAGAELATSNLADFEPFVPLGLRLMK